MILRRANLKIFRFCLNFANLHSIQGRCKVFKLMVGNAAFSDENTAKMSISSANQSVEI